MRRIVSSATRSPLLTLRSITVFVMCGILSAAASAAGVTLTGTVLGPDEAPVAGLTLEAGSSQAVTDDAGAFRLTGLDSGDTIVRLSGEAGEGRVAVVLGQDETSVMLTYPVITTVVLLHDNDTHFDFNYIEAFSAKVESIREQFANVYLLNAGDIFVRHADRWAEPNDVAYYRERSAFMITTMNAVGFDACTLGNHELFYIEGYTREALELAEFPLLSANIRLDTDKLPPLKPYVVFETDNGLSLAVLGLSRANRRPGIEVLDFIETAREYAHLADEHDLFVALTHIGLRTDRELAETMPELDVIIGGHSHNVLGEGERVNGVLIGMAGGAPHQEDPERPKYLGKIRVTLENGRVIDKTARVFIFEAEVAQPVS